MSNKRALYKPAIQDSAGNKDRRKPLAQGRLMTQPPNINTVTQSIAQGVLATSADCKNVSIENDNPRGVLTSAVRKNLSVSVKGRHLKAGAQLGRDYSEENAGGLSPRRETPHASMMESPQQLKPSRSLELSDTESEGLFSPTGQRKREGDHGAVVVVDATTTSSAAVVNNNEVDVNVSYTASPAKVICHTAAAVRDSLDRLSGDVVAARTVEVDKVHSVPMVSSQPPQRQLFLDDRKGSVNSSLEVSTESDQSRYSNASELMPKKTGGQNESKEGVKKKKSVRVVPSRYMQAATDSRKGPMKATDRTLLTKSSSAGAGVPASATKSALASSRKLTVRKTPSAMSKSAGGGAKSSLKCPGGLSTAPSRARTPKVFVNPCTPEATRRKVPPLGAKKASTPTADMSTLHPLGGVDVSAIGGGANRHMHSSLFSTPSLDGSALDHSPQPITSSRLGRLQDSASESARVSQSTENTKKRPTKKSLEQIQKRLDLQYHRYLQWVFLDSKLRKTTQDQEKLAMRQLYAVWDETEKLRRRKTELELELAKIKHLNELDEILDIQECGLTQVVDNLPVLETQYRTLASAVDTTRHQMAARGVYIPETGAAEEQYNDKLLNALEESEQLLGELSILTRKQVPTLTSFSTTLGMMENTVKNELSELSRVEELVCAAQSLITKESSLRIQQIQTQEGDTREA